MTDDQDARNSAGYGIPPAPPSRPSTRKEHRAAVVEPAPRPTPWAWVDPQKIPLRKWLYGRFLCRGVVSLTISPGGLGKSSLTIAEAVAMVTGRPLLGQPVRSTPLRVWILALEEGRDELNRRVAAICSHYNVSESDIGGRLFINSGLETPLQTAAMRDNKGGFAVENEIFAQIEAHIEGEELDVVIVDPFVSSHNLPENDNVMQDRLAKAWASLAQRTNTSISLVHHTRKAASGQHEHDAESARGASALINAARSVRVLNGMTKDEAAEAGLPEGAHREYFRVHRDKQNLAPPELEKNWYQIVGVFLNNGEGDGPLANGDSVGVVRPWRWPDPFEGLGASDLLAVQSAIDGKDLSASAQHREWVGHAVGEVLGFNSSEKSGKNRIKQLLKEWIASGALMIVQIEDARHGRDRPIVRVGRRSTAAPPTSEK